MDSEIKGNSLDQLIGYYEHSSAESQISILKESYSISDFNNVETADRKLIINNKLEFWVHDNVLNTYCDYFKISIESEHPKKNPYHYQSCGKNLTSQKNYISIKEFDFFEEESSKRNKTEESNNNININNNINSNNINNNNINNNNINNNFYSKYILKNSNTNIKSYKASNTQKNINKEKPKEIINIKDESKIKRKNSDNINKSNIDIKENKEMKELLDIINTSETTTIKDDIKDIKITRINIPNKKESDLFFEVLLWMYTKDKTKLKKFCKNFESLLHLLSLGIFLKMKKEYFYVLLSNLKIIWDKKLFDNPLWTRDKFSFHVLEKIIPLINSNYLRIYALISWLKSIDIKTNEIIKDKDTINNCLKSKDFFLVRNYMKKYKLINGLAKEELIDIKNNFEEYIDCLDMDGILNNYLFIPLTCVICKKEFSSVYEVLEHKNCTNSKYHPPCGTMENCQHKGCQKRCKKGEYNCCHKKLNEKDSGCLLGEGKHIFVMNNKNK